MEIAYERGGVKIRVDGKEFFFKGRGALPAVLPKKALSEKEIVAPLAGIVSEIFVEKGDFVKKDQKVLSLASMKMENEIVSQFDGRVKEILVKKKQEVKEGETLIILA